MFLAPCFQDFSIPLHIAVSANKLYVSIAERFNIGSLYFLRLGSQVWTPVLKYGRFCAPELGAVNRSQVPYILYTDRLLLISFLKPCWELCKLSFNFVQSQHNVFTYMRRYIANLSACIVQPMSPSLNMGITSLISQKDWKHPLLSGVCFTMGWGTINPNLVEFLGTFSSWDLFSSPIFRGCH